MVDLLDPAFPSPDFTTTGTTGSSEASKPDVMVAALNQVIVTSLQPFFHY